MAFFRDIDYLLLQKSVIVSQLIAYGMLYYLDMVSVSYRCLNRHNRQLYISGESAKP